MFSQSSAQAFSPRKKGKTCARGPTFLGFLCLITLGFSTPCPFAPEAARAATADGQSQTIVADNPLAAEAGLDILRAGGTATDAAIAALLVLGLVEPQAAGIGGGAFLLHYDAKHKRVDSYDGQVTAPAGSSGRLFLDKSGAPLSGEAVAVGGRAVGVPGLLRLAQLAHQDHGRLPWSALFAPAIALAERGFRVSARLHRAIAEDSFLLSRPATAGYFYGRGGRAVGSGDRLHNQAYADSLRRIAEGGPTAFYSGAIAQNIVSTVRNDRENPGFMTLYDLESYRAKRRLTLCIPYRIWRICSMPPPSAGGLALLQAMSLLGQFDLASLPPNGPAALRLMTEAERLADADRALFLADPDLVQLPLQRLLDPVYLRQRAALISPDRSLGEVTPGLVSDRFAAMPPQPDTASATPLSVVDQWGNAAALTASLHDPFGARLMVDGFLLDNGLADFAYTPRVDDRPVANRVEGGKRPVSSMVPTMVLDRQGRLLLAIGSSGGAGSIGFVLRTLVARLDWGLALDDAIVPGSGLNVIGRKVDRWIGATDPRRNGAVLAD